MSDYATTKQAILDECTTDEARASVESNYTEALYDELQLISSKGKAE
tara:strand:- start:1430 stop:1570 length:141 start_codon:yes stop_codon:yes gene_type:complete